MSFYYINTSDNIKLRAAYWLSETPESVGTVCLFQGRSEFIEKYTEVILELRRRGFCVAAFDWRGQGGSQRLLKNPFKGHIDDFELYQRDIDAFLQHVSSFALDKPLYALAHSMGATALIKAIAACETCFERAVFSAPMIELLGLRMPFFAKTLAHFLNYLGFGGCFVPGGGRKPISAKPFEDNLLSSDPIRYQRTVQMVQNMPELSLGDPTISWVSSAFQSMNDLKDSDFGIYFNTPSLIISGTADQLCSTPAAMKFAAHLRQCKGIEIAGARHEILMETDHIRSQFWAAFDTFIPGKA